VGYFAFRDTTLALEGLEMNALAIASDSQSVQVFVEKNDTRAKMRDALRASLQNFVSSESASPAEPNTTTLENEVIDGEETVAEPPTVEIPICNDETNSQNGIETWGVLDISLQAGVRRIASKDTTPEGVSMYELKTLETPEIMETPRCVAEGTVVGVARDGRLLRGNTSFVPNAEGIQGYARDGFGIFSPYEDGREVMSADLDVCHGHVHPIVWDGEAMSLYHYHVTNDSPYTVSCYRGTPVPLP